MHTAGYTAGTQSVILKGGNRKQGSQALPSARQHLRHVHAQQHAPQMLEDQKEEPRKGGNPTVHQEYKSHSKFSPNSQYEETVHYLIVGAWDSGSLVFSTASRDRVPRLALLPFREESLTEPVLGSSSEELSSKEPRIKLVISCLLMCACFLSSLEGDVARWPGGLAGKDKPLASGTSEPGATVQFVWSSGEGQVSLEDSGFLGGFWCEAGREFLC